MANAGPDQSLLNHGITVTLDGSGSNDPDNNVPITYAWSILTKPAGSTATLSAPKALDPNFLADRPGNYVMQLIVTDSKGLASDPDTVTITSGNAAPQAVAGPAQAIIEVGATVNLDGTQSWDPRRLSHFFNLRLELHSLAGKRR